MPFEVWKCGRCMVREDGGPLHVPQCPKVVEHPHVPRNGIAIIVEVIEAFGPDLDWSTVDGLAIDAIEYYLSSKGVVGVNCAAERAYLDHMKNLGED